LWNVPGEEPVLASLPKKGAAMRIAMFGATGTVGGTVLRHALDRGHDVRVLARTPGKVSVAGVDVVAGDALDAEAVAKTVVGCDVVVSALGGFGGTASIDSGTENIIAAMRTTGPRRLVLVQGFHIPFPGDPRNAGVRIVDTMLRLRSPSLVSRSHRLGDLLRATQDIDWTLIRICPVKAGPPTGSLRRGTLRLGPFDYVTDGDVAEAVLDAIDDPQSIHTAPMAQTARRRR